jgi:hypothetical protein
MKQKNKREKINQEKSKPSKGRRETRIRPSEAGSSG